MRHFGTNILVSSVAVLVFAPAVTSFFVADDWPVIAENVTITWQRMWQLSTIVNSGWYRPLFNLFIGLLWNTFGLNPVGYHIAVLLLYVVVSATVGTIGYLLTANRRIGILSTILFTIYGAHAEPVLWIASSNEVLAGFFVVMSTTAYILFRKSSNYSWLLCAILFFLFSLASKETAAFLPLVLIVYDICICRRTELRSGLRGLLPIVPFLSAGTAFVVYRFLTGSPYSTSVGVLRILENAIYYVAVEILALPDNYGYATSLPLWRQEPLLPIVTVGLSASSFVILGWFFLKSGKRVINTNYLRALTFAVAWGITALSPVILTATGRTAFLSSIGVVWSVAILFVAAWDSLLPHEQAKQWILIALAMVLGSQLIVTSYRTYWWGQAGITVQEVTAEIGNELQNLQGQREIWLIGLPDHLNHAYVFRNAFPGVNTLLFPDWNIRAVLDSKAKGQTIQQATARVSQDHPSAVIFRYETTGKLTRIR